jgi:pimeloyl-ACP methyl ester carboxylesterase
MRSSRILASLVWLALPTLLAAAVAGPSPAHGGTTESLVGGSSVRTDDVCFVVHNEGDPRPRKVYGARYYVADPGPSTKVIILVHGNSLTHAFWDVRPDHSVARHLAAAGYLVIAYDRLGYGKSPYGGPHGAGYTLTISSQRAMLHEIVGQVKAGRYAFAPDGTCASTGGPPVGLASPTVILVGHSAGGAIVSGYPGTYHDVAAMVQAGFNNQGFSPSVAVYVAGVWLPQAAAGKDYWILAPTIGDCERVFLYRPGAASSLLPQFCEPPSLVPGPAGEVTGAGRMYIENLLAIDRVGPGLPVLLAWADHDFFFPEGGETRYWKVHCGCDVETWTQRESGHAFVAHKSMPTFTAAVVDWLFSRGLGAR